MTSVILYRIGNISSPSVSTPGITLYHKYKDDSQKQDLLMKIGSLFVDIIHKQIDTAKPNNEPIDITPFITIMDSFLINVLLIIYFATLIL
ncbi:hypothetical protein LCGC14_2657900 [marine sediment metagenome]|uniref:Uncharacterized protein n=1 Tax=marine sediment metagenome TaxID=412755 RepID=A0A0F8ZSZ4_9ZZZZ